MDYDTLLKNFDELNEFIAKAREEMKNKSTGLIEEAARRLFEAAPEIGQVHWTQYTPYFNDGEACEFGVNDINWASVEDVEEGEWDIWDSSELYTTDDLKSAQNDLVEAAKYEDDPQAWRDAYRERYLKDYGREPWNLQSARPYPSTRKEAEAKIRKIEAALAKYEGRADAIQEAFRSFKDAMAKIPEDIMQSVYGDHVMVIIDRDGTHIDEYDHD